MIKYIALIIVALILIVSLSGCGNGPVQGAETPSLTSLSYTVDDLPSDKFDPSKIDGEVLSFYGPSEEQDPALWTVLMGGVHREGFTNDYVSSIKVISSEVSTNISLQSDPETGKSTTWIIESWIKPGPNYIVVEAVGFEKADGTIPTKRYTLVGYGVMPDNAEPELR
jgi:hypothetical protein